MLWNVYSVKDELSGEFLQPTFAEDDVLATRDFKFKINNIEMWKYNSSDYSLYKLGNFDTKTGIYVSNIDKLASGRSVLDA